MVEYLLCNSAIIQDCADLASEKQLSQHEMHLSVTLYSAVDRVNATIGKGVDLIDYFD